MFEIGPIQGIRSLPSIRSKAADRGLLEIFETEYLARSGDETYSRNGAKSAGGSEDEFEESTAEAEAAAEPLSLPAPAGGEDPKINLFV
jgi:hypothetical protein